MDLQENKKKDENHRFVRTGNMKVCFLQENLWDGFSRNISEADQACQKDMIPHISWSKTY